jgi:hypothetical protein
VEGRRAAAAWHARAGYELLSPTAAHRFAEVIELS